MLAQKPPGTFILESFTSVELKTGHCVFKGHTLEMWGIKTRG